MVDDCIDMSLSGWKDQRRADQSAGHHQRLAEHTAPQYPSPGPQGGVLEHERRHCAGRASSHAHAQV